MSSHGFDSRRWRFSEESSGEKPKEPLDFESNEVNKSRLKVGGKRSHSQAFGEEEESSLLSRVALSLERDDEEGLDDSDDEFQLDSDVERDDEQDERDFARQQARIKKNTRISKPMGLFERLLGQSNLQEYKGSMTEGDVIAERRKAYGEDVKAPKGREKEPKYQVDCGRCKKPILLSSQYEELGVEMGNRKPRRQAPPIGHVRDLSTYVDPLESRLDTQDFSAEDDQDRVRQETKRQAVWDFSNLRLEHFDCNARAPKIRAQDMNETQRQGGLKYVNKNFDKWMKLARNGVQFKGRKARKHSEEDTLHGPVPASPPSSASDDSDRVLHG